MITALWVGLVMVGVTVAVIVAAEWRRAWAPFADRLEHRRLRRLWLRRWAAGERVGPVLPTADPYIVEHVEPLTDPYGQMPVGEEFLRRYHRPDLMGRGE
jgi:hypothetical protein